MKLIVEMRNLLVVGLIALAVVSCNTEAKRKAEQVKADSLRVVDSIATVIKDKPYLREMPSNNPDFFKINKGELFVFKGRVATQEDAMKHEAVFFIDSKGDPSHQVVDVHLPFYAYLTDGTHERDLVFIMQAEVFKGDTVYGYKDAKLRMGMCYANDLEFLQLDKMKFE